MVGPKVTGFVPLWQKKDTQVKSYLGKNHSYVIRPCNLIRHGKEKSGKNPPTFAMEGWLTVMEWTSAMLISE